MEAWVILIGAAAAAYLKNLVGDSVDGLLITAASRQSLINNVKLNGVPLWLMKAIERQAATHFGEKE